MFHATRPALALASMVSACSWPAAGDGRPACDSPVVASTVRSIADEHPDHAPHLPAASEALVDIRETGAKAFPHIGKSTFRRLCVGTLVVEGGEQIETGWEIFTTDTLLGPTYGVGPCFGAYDAAGRDCTAFGRGLLPGEVAEAAEVP